MKEISGTIKTIILAIVIYAVSGCTALQPRGSVVSCYDANGQFRGQGVGYPQQLSSGYMRWPHQTPFIATDCVLKGVTK
jgi:hypothetical protein